MTENRDPFNSTPAPSTPAPDINLAQYDTDFEQAEAAENEEVPDGKYQVRVHAARLNHSQAGNPMLQYDLVVISGQHLNRHIFKNSVITANSMPFLKADLKVMEIQLPKLSDLPGKLEAMLDLTLEVTKKTKGEYANVYFNKKLNVPAGAATPPPVNNIPF